MTSNTKITCILNLKQELQKSFQLVADSNNSTGHLRAAPSSLVPWGQV